MNTWIKLYRKITEWQWYSDVNCKVVFLHLLLTVNWNPTNWHDIVIDRGEMVTSISALAKAVGLTIQQTRTALEKLVKSEAIEKITTNKFSIIRVVNFSDYQCIEQQTNNKQNTLLLTNKQQSPNTDIEPVSKENLFVTEQTNNKQNTCDVTTIKEINKNNNIYNNYINNSDFAKIVEVYQQNISMPTPIVYDILKDLASSHNADLMELAIQEAVKSNAKNIRYIEGIFKNWDSLGIKTVADARLAILSRKANAVSHASEQKQPRQQKHIPFKPNTFNGYGTEYGASDLEKKLLRERMKKYKTKENDDE